MKSTFIAIFIGVAGFAQRVTDTSMTVIPEVFVSNYHVSDSLMNTAASVSVIGTAILERGNHSDISPAINSAAGVFMQTGALNTNRISIRGIGARTPFGTNKIRAFYGNIPLTSGDSETTIEDLNTENISQVEIIKGPMSSVYGAGLGGAILISPQISRTGSRLGVSSTFGSFGLLKSNYDFSSASETKSINVNIHKLSSDGWRQNSQYNREGLTVAGDLFRSENTNLTYIGAYTYLKAYIPSSITREDFESDPQAAAPTWLAAKGNEQYKSYLGGLSYEFAIGEIRNATSVFFNVMDSNEPRPFDILKQHTEGFGARTQFSGAINFGRMKPSYILGAEYFRDGFKGRTFENLYQQNNGEGSLQGEKLTTVKQKRNFYNLFAQVRVPIIKKLELHGGVNFNRTSFEIRNSFPEESAASENYSYDLIASPQVSLLWKPVADNVFHISASRGFSHPSVEETLTATGAINSDIKPEQGDNFEVGAKMYFLNRKLFVEAAAFRMKIRDLLVARRVGDDQYVGINAGRTLHQGIEAAVRYDEQFANFGLTAFISGSTGKFEFLEFIDGNEDFSGNELTGVPKTKINGGFTLWYKGAYLESDAMLVSQLPLNDANSEQADGYEIINVKFGYQVEATQHLRLNFSAGANNVSDKKYASMVLVNATAPPQGSPRYFYPGMPVNYFGGFSAVYVF